MEKEIHDQWQKYEYQNVWSSHHVESTHLVPSYYLLRVVIQPTNLFLVSGRLDKCYISFLAEASSPLLHG